MKWSTQLTLGRITYNLELPRDTGSLAQAYTHPTWAPTPNIEDMVLFDALIDVHNDSFVQQQSSDLGNTIANHYNGLYFMTKAEVDIRDKLFDGRLINLDNINIQRQHSVPWSGMTYNIDEGGMIDEYLILARAPLYDDNLPANSVPKLIPQDFGLKAGFGNTSDMQDIILCERRRYQPDARFVATQPQTAATTYGDLGSPAENPTTAGTRRFVSFSLSDVETWGDTNAPINGPTIYCYRYVRVYASERDIQRFGTGFSGPVSPEQDAAYAKNYEFLQMALSFTLPAVHITLEGDAYEANLGQLAVAYEKKLLQRARLEREVERGRPTGMDDGDGTADDHRTDLGEVLEDYR